MNPPADPPFDPNNRTPSAIAIERISADPLPSAMAPVVSITGLGDPEGDPLDIFINWGAGFEPLATGLLSPYDDLELTGPQINNHTKG